MEQQLQQAYNELKSRPQPTTTIETTTSNSGDETYDSYTLTKFPALQALVSSKIPSAIYVYVEVLSQENQQVFNLMFFDSDEEDVGGCELTPTQLYWDDDNS